MKLVYGLGNPGNRYLLTRHNLGCMVTDLLAQEYGIVMKKKSSGMLAGTGAIDGVRVMLAKPITYMNLSGEPLKFLSFRPADLIVIHDDLDLPFGRIRIRPKGGAGGHRGVLSIMESLAGGNFYRVRVGIGRPSEGVDAVDFVLEEFALPEVDQLKELLSRASEAVVSLLQEGGRRAMEQYNRAP